MLVNSYCLRFVRVGELRGESSVAAVLVHHAGGRRIRGCRGDRFDRRRAQRNILAEHGRRAAIGWVAHHSETIIESARN